MHNKGGVCKKYYCAIKPRSETISCKGQPPPTHSALTYPHSALSPPSSSALTHTQPTAIRTPPRLAVGCGVCDTPELWCGAAGLCARVCTCAGAAESLHTYILRLGLRQGSKATGSSQPLGCSVAHILYLYSMLQCYILYSLHQMLQ